MTALATVPENDVQVIDRPLATITVTVTDTGWEVEAVSKVRTVKGRPVTHRSNVVRCNCGRPVKQCFTRQWHQEDFDKYLGKFVRTFRRPAKRK